MKIVYLVAGAGGMYCGSCLHGNTLVAGLRKLGEEAILAPMYTPLRTDEENCSIDRVAFGGINVYLQEHSSIFRHTPWFFDRMLDRPGLLRWIARRSATVRPEHLGDITVSMLQGEQGHQQKEVEKLVCWLREMQPDLVHLNNILLIGPAREIRRRLKIPVVCSLTGEDIFLERLMEPHHSLARQILRERAAELNGFTSMNGYFADFMAEYLSIPRTMIEVIPPGLNLENFGPKTTYRTDRRSPFTIGYFARICPEKGLHLLTDALKILAADPSLPPVHVKAAGYLDAADRNYVNDLTERLAEANLADRFEYLGELDRPAKIAFLQSLDLLSIPTLYRESKGLSVFEGWAVGVPAVLPRHGAFPEMIEATRGGILCTPDNPTALAQSLKQYLVDPEQAQRAGQNARQIVHHQYHAEKMAQRMAAWYKKVGAMREGE